MMPVDETLLSRFNAYARGGLAIGSDPMMVRISLDPA
jgi:hypothetical protein